MKFTMDESFKKKALKAADMVVEDAAIGLTNYIKNNKLHDQVLNARTSALRNSIIHVKEGTAHYRVGPDVAVPYAAVHEFGSSGPIKPKRGKFLAIPIGDALNPTGTVKAAYKDGPGDHKDLTLIPRPGKPSLLVRKPKRGRGSWKLLFVLVKSVTIPARPFLRPSFAEQHKKMTDRAGKRFAELMGL